MTNMRARQNTIWKAVLKDSSVAISLNMSVPFKFKYLSGRKGHRWWNLSRKSLMSAGGPKIERSFLSPCCIWNPGVVMVVSLRSRFFFFFCESRLKKTARKNSTTTLSSVNRDYVAQIRRLYSKWTAKLQWSFHTVTMRRRCSLSSCERGTNVQFPTILKKWKRIPTCPFIYPSKVSSPFNDW